MLNAFRDQTYYAQNYAGIIVLGLFPCTAIASYGIFHIIYNVILWLYPLANCLANFKLYSGYSS